MNHRTFVNTDRQVDTDTIATGPTTTTANLATIDETIATRSPHPAADHHPTRAEGHHVNTDRQADTDNTARSLIRSTADATALDETTTARNPRPHPAATRIPPISGRSGVPVRHQPPIDQVKTVKLTSAGPTVVVIGNTDSHRHQNAQLHPRHRVEKTASATNATPSRPQRLQLPTTKTSDDETPAARRGERK